MEQLDFWQLPIPHLNVIDVGVSGGVQHTWRAWGDALHGVGFDPVLKVIAGLSSSEQCATFRYENAWVTSQDKSRAESGHKLGGVASDYALHRTSAYAATEIFEKCIDEVERVDDRRQWPKDAAFSDFPDPAADPFVHHHSVRMNGGDEPTYTDRRITLDSYFGTSPNLPSVLKIDTDGHDFDVLKGAEKLLRDDQLLFVEIECQFNGPFDPNANTFTNIDGFLRSNGFSLCKLDPYQYSRRALPYPFTSDVAAQTVGGALVWADALYVKDIVPRVLEGKAVPRDSLMTYLLVYDAYSLCDCAAEILVEASEQLQIGDALRQKMLDFLTEKVTNRPVSHAEYIAQFKRDPFGLT